MKILLVTNAMYVNGQGISKSVRNTYSYLRNVGMDVRVLTMQMPNPNVPVPDYPMKKFHFPFFQRLIESQGFCYASSKRKQIRQAVAWADVIHIAEPFVLEMKTTQEAYKQGKACVATFHIHPENILSSLCMGKWKAANNLLQKIFNKLVFNYCSDVQCPSENAKLRLLQGGYKGTPHVFSNGIEIEDGVVPDEPVQNPYQVVCVGRFSKEKNQQTLIEAMPLCKHKDEIQFIFAGQGPMQKKYECATDRYYKSGKLKYRPQYKFCSKDELKDLVRKSYLAIHCAVIEIEGLSIMEAMCQGTVPVVADGPLSAASQFTLSAESRYTALNAKELANRIDWWIEHPQERRDYSAKYIETMRQYNVHNSIAQLIDMYKGAISKSKQR